MFVVVVVVVSVVETIPQSIFQTLLLFEVFKGLSEANIRPIDVYLSVLSAFINSIVQILRLIIESKACGESFTQYSLECLLARISWIPNQKKISKLLKTGNALKTMQIEPITFDIKYQLPCTSWNTISKYHPKVEFDFSSLTIQFCVLYSTFSL